LISSMNRAWPGHCPAARARKDRVMISRLRSWIAVTLAILVTALTFGLVEVNPTGGPGAGHEQDDPARPRVAEPRSRNP
jgi:hypothetical protein